MQKNMNNIKKKKKYNPYALLCLKFLKAHIRDLLIELRLALSGYYSTNQSKTVTN